MLDSKDIITCLNLIYAQIPNIPCTHCHQCCGPIFWFKPEEINIRNYLKKHQKKYLVWSTEEFQKHDMRCPYLINDRCSIYPVRPIVCRLQGNVPELACKQKKHPYLSKQKRTFIKRKMDTLVQKTDGIGLVYGTRRLIEQKP